MGLPLSAPHGRHFSDVESPSVGISADVEVRLAEEVDETATRGSAVSITNLCPWIQ